MFFKTISLVFIVSSFLFSCTPEPIDNRTQTTNPNASNGTFQSDTTLQNDGVQSGVGDAGTDCTAGIAKVIDVVHNAGCNSCHASGGGIAAATAKFVINTADAAVTEVALQNKIAESQFGTGSKLIDWLVNANHQGNTFAAEFSNNRTTYEPIFDNCFQ